MQKSRKAVYPLLALCFILLLGGYWLGRRSTRGVVLTTERAAPAQTAAVLPAGTQSAEPPARELPVREASDSPARPQRIDLNTATREELMTLPGIGEVRAQRILDYRAAHGPFSSTAELMNVNGIGTGIYAGLRDLVFVEEQHEDSDY